MSQTDVDGPMGQSPSVPNLKQLKGKAVSFRSLQKLDLSGAKMHEHLPLGPEDLLYGDLPCGMKYYVRQNKKPKDRAALALVVRVGSVVETEEERGIAHIVEHLAFSATERFNNHDIVKFLESIGAAFGACQNAYTSADETVYELLLPVDKEGLLPKAFSVLAEFATKVRISDEDIEKERGAVLEEWRQGRTSHGRAAEAHWKLVMEGSQYQDRLPIGLEKVIRGAPAEVARAFYDKWYRPENMAVVAVGDFSEGADAVLGQLREAFSKCEASGEGPAPPVPRFPIPPHTDTRYEAFDDKEITQSAVYVSCSHPRAPVSTPADFRRYLIGELFHAAMNQRFFVISRGAEPPFYSASAGMDELAAPMQSYCLSASVEEGGSERALETLLTELARVRIHGLSEREIKVSSARILADMETNYLEREQAYSTDLRDEYVRHFLHGEFVVGQELEARLARTLVPSIRAEELTEVARKYHPRCSCVVKTVEHQRRSGEDKLRAVVERVTAAEEGRMIGPWVQDDIPEDLLAEEPDAGSVTGRREFPVLGCTEITLSNGMRVAYKRTDFLDDQVLLAGTAVGGLSEAKRDVFRSCSTGTLIASEMGYFGFKPEVISEMLAGKRCELKPAVGAFRRSFAGDQSPADLETSLQLVHLLFTTRVEPVEDDLRTVMRMTRESIASQLRDPFTQYANRVKCVNYGSCYYFQPLTLEEFDAVDPLVACDHFDKCFKNPAEFSVAMVGNVDVSKAVPLIERYLASIPPCGDAAVARRALKDVTSLPTSFPMHVVKEDVKLPMVQALTSTQITFPVRMREGEDVEDSYRASFACRLLETKLMQLLRFKYGEVYTVSVSVFFGAEAPSRKGDLRADVAINFSCDPAAAEKLVEMSLEELERLQEHGPEQAEVDTVVELDRRAHETQVLENSYWQDRILGAYNSRVFAATGDLDAAFQRREAARKKVLGEMSPESMHQALRRIFPLPCRSRYTAITLKPQRPLLARLLLPDTSAGRAVLAAAACAAALVVARRWRGRGGG